MKLRALAIVTALALPTAALAQSPSANPPAPDKLPSETTGDKPNDKSMDPPAKPGDKNAKLSDGDVAIIAHLHHVNLMEIDAAKLAQKSGTAAIKSYTDTLVKDHQGNDKDLASFAKQHKLAAIPAEKPQTDAEKQDDKDMAATMAHLKTIKGSDFDKAFLSVMVTGHDKELAKIDTSIGAAGDPDLQAMLKSVKPVLQRHADQAKDLQKGPQASADQMPDKLPSQR